MPIVHLKTIRAGYFSAQWKVVQIIMIPKSGKQLEEVGSCRPIGLHTITSKTFETAMLKKLRQILEENRIFPNQQFGFQQQHFTIEQFHRITEFIRGTLEQGNSSTLRRS
jgi:hypothetical protein